MEKQKKVVDASIVVKWFSKEENSEKALKLREDYLNGEIILLMPILIKFEVLNALRYKDSDENKLKKVNEDLEKIGFKIIDINKSNLDKTINISLRYNITIYDAVYVALAQLYGCDLITADKELYKIPNVIPLEKT